MRAGTITRPCTLLRLRDFRFRAAKIGPDSGFPQRIRKPHEHRRIRGIRAEGNPAEVELRHDPQQHFLVANTAEAHQHGPRIGPDDMNRPAVTFLEVHQRAHAQQGSGAAVKFASGLKVQVVLFWSIFIDLNKLAEGHWKDSVFGSTEWIDFELRLKPSYDDSEAKGI
jgi:hypothetical protein